MSRYIQLFLNSIMVIAVFLLLFLTYIHSMFFDVQNVKNVLSVGILVIFGIKAICCIKSDSEISMLEVYISGIIAPVLLITCNIYFAGIALLIGIIEIVYMSVVKKKYDTWFHFLFSEIATVEVLSMLCLIVDIDFVIVQKKIRISFLIDLVFIIATFLLIYKEKIIGYINKKNNDNEKIVVDYYYNWLIVGVCYLSFIIAIRIYIGLLFHESFLHMVVAVVLIVLNCVFLLLCADVMCSEKSFDDKWLCVSATMLLTCMLYSFVSLIAWTVSIMVLVATYFLVKFVKNQKCCYGLIFVVFLTQTIGSMILGIRAYPAFLYAFCLVLIKVDLKKYIEIIILCSVIFVCVDIEIVYKNYVGNYMDYIDVINICKKVDGNYEYKINVGYTDNKLVKLLKESGFKVNNSKGTIKPDSINIVARDTDTYVMQHMYFKELNDNYFVFNSSIYTEIGGNNFSAEYVNDQIELSVDINEDTRVAVVKVANVSDIHHDIAVAVWNLENDQDDVVWYPLEKKADGYYEQKIDLTKHEGESNIKFHIYGACEGEIEFMEEYIY